MATLPMPSPIAVSAGPSIPWNCFRKSAKPLLEENLPAWPSSWLTTSANVLANGTMSGSSLSTSCRPELNTLNASGSNARLSLPNSVTRPRTPCTAACSLAGSLAIASWASCRFSSAVFTAAAFVFVGSAASFACAAL